MSTSEERVTSSAALKKKVDVKKTDLVAFLLRYKVHMRQLENSDMIDKNGDYAEFVAVLEHVAKGGNMYRTTDIESWERVAKRGNICRKADSSTRKGSCAS